jgi:hypothetical protein
LNATFGWILQGYHLEGILQYTLDDKPYETRLLVSYDGQAKRYQAHFIDNFSAAPSSLSGSFIDDRTLVLTGTRKQDAQVVKERVRLVFLAQDEWQLTSGSDVLGTMTDQLTLRASRKK